MGTLNCHPEEVAFKLGSHSSGETKGVKRHMARRGSSTERAMHALCSQGTAAHSPILGLTQPLERLDSLCQKS